jgi:hypothetical protein
MMGIFIKTCNSQTRATQLRATGHALPANYGLSGLSLHRCYVLCLQSNSRVLRVWAAVFSKITWYSFHILRRALQVDFQRSVHNYRCYNVRL